MKRPVTVDFETFAINQRPAYPPEPVGVAIHWPGRSPKYYAFGHPTYNNCTKTQAITALREVWKSDHDVLFHNAKFDLAVAYEKLGLSELPWERVHDTMFLLFLDDPYSKTLALKPSAERYLGMPPTEQEEVRDWLYDNGVIPRNVKEWGAYIAYAPGDLVGKYAIGDVVRTGKLFEVLMKRIKDRGMLQAYNVERELMPFLMENERLGVRVDADALRRDIATYSQANERVEKWLRKRLGARDINFDSNDELADALEESGVVAEFALTKKGNRSVAKDSLTIDRFTDAKVWYALAYRSRLGTCMGTFMRPWLEMAVSSGGYIYTNWNQVRQVGAGAKTGRMSCTPNLMNIPKTFEGRADGYKHPKFIRYLIELPLIRRYVLPDKPSHLFGHRDFNQQELRILAHFEDGGLLEAYLANPRLDVHTHVQGELAKLGLIFERGAVKTTNFGMVYGMGAPGLSRSLNISYADAKTLIAAQRRAMPGLDDLIRSIKQHVNAGQPIITWGGRQYFVEPPTIVDGERRSNDYKMLNYLIQGSAADCTKRALINYASHPKREAHFLVTVHDEINFSAPKSAIKKEMAVLKECMDAVEFDLPLISDGKVGPNWGSLTAYKD